MKPERFHFAEHATKRQRHAGRFVELAVVLTILAGLMIWRLAPTYI